MKQSQTFNPIINRHIFLVRKCGVWCIARMLYNAGFPIKYALLIVRLAKI